MHKLGYYLISDRFPSLLHCHFLSHLSHCLAFNANSTQHSSSLSLQHVSTPSILLTRNMIIFFTTQPQHLFLLSSVFSVLIFGQTDSFCTMSMGNKLVPSIHLPKILFQALTRFSYYYILFITFYYSLDKNLCTTYSNATVTNNIFLASYWSSFSFQSCHCLFPVQHIKQQLHFFHGQSLHGLTSAICYQPIYSFLSSDIIHSLNFHSSISTISPMLP